MDSSVDRWNGLWGRWIHFVSAIVTLADAITACDRIGETVTSSPPCDARYQAGTASSNASEPTCLCTEDEIAGTCLSSQNSRYAVGEAAAMALWASACTLCGSVE